VKVTGLNHITLAVADVERSLAFYRDVPGLNVRAVWPEGACLEVGALWLCLSQDSLRGHRHIRIIPTSPSVFPGQISTISANACLTRALCGKVTGMKERPPTSLIQTGTSWKSTSGRSKRGWPIIASVRPGA